MSMNPPDDENLIIQGSLRNFHLIDAAQAARNRSALLILAPPSSMTYPDGRSVGRLNIYLEGNMVTTVQRNRYFAPNKVAALDLCFPYSLPNLATFVLTLIGPEPPGEAFTPLHFEPFFMEVAQYGDEAVEARQQGGGSGAIAFYRLAEHASRADRPRASEENADQFLDLLCEWVGPTQDFTVNELADAVGLSSTTCALFLEKLLAGGFIQSPSVQSAAYGGTVGGAGKRFLTRRPLPRPR